MEKDDSVRENPETAPKPKKGAGKQFFGVVLLSLGLLNSMLTLKAGLEPDWFIYLLMGGGAAFLATGIWQSRNS